MFTNNRYHYFKPSDNYKENLVVCYCLTTHWHQAMSRFIRRQPNNLMTLMTHYKIFKTLSSLKIKSYFVTLNKVKYVYVSV